MAVEILVLAGLFLFAAVIYSLAGFGGGSAYIAMMMLAGLSITHVAVVALVCNVIVVAGGSWQFARAGHLRPELVVPFLVTSIPAAFAGGHATLDSGILELIMAGALASAGVLLLIDVRRRGGGRQPPAGWRFWATAAILGAVLGGLAGVIGIGGGIFLAPVLHLLGWGTARQVAAVASIFILVNSLAGLAGKSAHVVDLGLLLTYLPLFVAVLIGGQIGSRIGAFTLPPVAIRRITAAIVLFAAVSLIVR